MICTAGIFHENKFSRGKSGYSKIIKGEAGPQATVEHSKWLSASLSLKTS